MPGTHAAIAADKGWAAAALAFVLVSARPAQAECLDCAEWHRIWSIEGIPTAIAYSHGWLVQAIAGAIYVQDPVDGTVLSSFNASSAVRAPAVADLNVAGFPQTYMFVAAGNGVLYKLDMATPLPVSLPIAKTGNAVQMRDLKRESCSSDTLLAEPVVQLVADSNAQFTLGKDIVMVATAHRCGDTTQNQVIALDAADLTADPLWVFNNSSYEAAAFRSCMLDALNNHLVCGAELPNGSFQNTLFSINTNDGHLAWAVAPESGIHARIALGAPGSLAASHLYVGDMSGHVRSFDAAEGTPLADVSVVGAEEVEKGIDEDIASADGIYAGLVLVTGSNGVLHAIYDAGSTLIPVWDTSSSSARVVTGPAVVSALGKAYAGKNDGKFHQFDLSSGTDEAAGLIASDGLTLEQKLASDMKLATYLGEDNSYHVAATFGIPSTMYMRSGQYRVPCRYGTPCAWNDTIFRANFD